MKPWTATLLFAGLVFIPVQADDGKKKDEGQKFQGVWRLVKFDTTPNRQPPKEFVAHARLIFESGTLTTKVGEKKIESTTFKIDPTKSPKWIDVVATSGPGMGKTAEGIYEIEGDHLKICIGAPGQIRPKEFKVFAEVDPPVAVMFLRRVMPKVER